MAHIARTRTSKIEGRTEKWLTRKDASDKERGPTFANNHGTIESSNNHTNHYMKPTISTAISLAFALPAAAPAAVDFVKDVQPILEFNCVRCHNPKATAVEKGDTSVELHTKAKAIWT